MIWALMAAQMVANQAVATVDGASQSAAMLLQKRVAAVKELLVAMKEQSQSAFDQLVAQDATATIDFKAVPVKVSAFKEFARLCTRRGKMVTESESGDVITAVFDCVGTQFKPDSLMALSFEGERASKIEILETIYVPTPPPMPSKPNG